MLSKNIGFLAVDALSRTGRNLAWLSSTMYGNVSASVKPNIPIPLLAWLPKRIPLTPVEAASPIVKAVVTAASNYTTATAAFFGCSLTCANLQLAPFEQTFAGVFHG